VSEEKKSPEEVVKETFRVEGLPKGTKVTVRVRGKVVKVIEA